MAQVISWTAFVEAPLMNDTMKSLGMGLCILSQYADSDSRNVEQHCSGVAVYAGLGVPIEDQQKLLALGWEIWSAVGDSRYGWLYCCW